jgi:hypothetical protein
MNLKPIESLLYSYLIILNQYQLVTIQLFEIAGSLRQSLFGHLLYHQLDILFLSSASIRWQLVLLVLIRSLSPASACLAGNHIGVRFF